MFSNEVSNLKVIKYSLCKVQYAPKCCVYKVLAYAIVAAMSFYSTVLGKNQKAIVCKMQGQWETTICISQLYKLLTTIIEKLCKGYKEAR